MVRSKKINIYESLKDFLNSNQGSIMLLLVIVTAVGIYLNNIQLQKIVSPDIGYIKYNAPNTIQGSTSSQFGVINYGYVAGTYTFKIKSDGLYISDVDQIKKNEIIFNYKMMARSDAKILFFLIPQENSPKRCSFSIELKDRDGTLLYTDNFCYALNPQGYYDFIPCSIP